MNTPTLPVSSQNNKTARQRVTVVADGPDTNTASVEQTATINADGSITVSSSTPNPGDTYTVTNNFAAAAVIWENGGASIIVGAGATPTRIICEAGDVYDITIIVSQAATPSFVNSKINVGSGPTDCD